MVEVKLKIRFIEDQNINNDKYTLSCEVVEYVNIPREIFVYQRDLENVDTFQTMATPVKIEQFPTTEPISPGGFFRKHTLFLEFNLLGDREEARSIIEGKAQQLVDDWQKLYPIVVSDEEVEFSSN